MGNVIHLGFGGGQKDTQGADLRSLRRSTGLNASEFAAAVAVEAGEPVPPRVYLAYEEDGTPPATIVAAARRIAARAARAHTGSGIEISSVDSRKPPVARVDGAIPVLRSASKAPFHADEVELAAHEAQEEQVALLTDRGSRPVALLWEEAAEIARAGNRGPREIFAACRQIHRQALFAAENTRRPGSLSDLYAIAGQTTALMASAAFDLDHWGAAETMAQSAVAYAELVGNQSLEAWTLGLAALLANWRNEPHVALDHIQHGLTIAPAGAPRVRLRFIAARSFGLLGDQSATTAALNEARRDQDVAERTRDSLSEEVGGEFAFGRARAEACAASAWLDLGHGEKAKVSAQQALAQLLDLPAGRQPFSQVIGARIDLATACIMQRQRDEAEEVLTSVLAIPPALRNVSLSGRLTRTRAVLDSGYWSGDLAAHELSEALGDWLAGKS